MNSYATLLSAFLVLTGSDAARADMRPIAEYIPSGDGGFVFSASDVVGVQRSEMYFGGPDRKMLLIELVRDKAIKWGDMTKQNVSGTVSFKLCGRIIVKDVRIQSQMAGPAIITVSNEDLDWTVAVLLGQRACDPVS
jgi:hypothetical protein